MSESTNNDLPEMYEFKSGGKFIIVAFVIMMILLALGFVRVVQMSQSSTRSHDGCVVKGTNTFTGRSGAVQIDVYAEGCSNTDPNEPISYFHGPVYANILEYENAREAKSDYFIEADKTYNFKTEVRPMFFGESETIQEITPVK